MRKFSLLFFVVATFVLTACTDPAKPQVLVEKAPAPARPANAPAGHTDEGHDAPRILLAEAKKDFDTGTAVFIDTHVKATYDHEHVKGAINVTVQELQAKIDTIPKGKKIIAYCS